MTLREDEQSTVLKVRDRVTLEEGVGDSRVFRDLEYTFCLQHVRRGERVLDIGTSQPWFLLELSNRGCNVVTLDVNSGAMLHTKRVGIDCVLASITNLPFRSGFFSVVLCISTIEHVHGDDDISGMREIVRVTKRTLIILPMGKADNWSPHDRSRERRYNWSLLRARILLGWKIRRRAQISVWDSNLNDYLSEECLYLSQGEGL